MKLTFLLLALILTAPLASAYPLYHDISDTAGAQAEASERHLPIAFLGITPGVLELPSPPPDSDAGLAQMALGVLQGRAVVVALNGLTMAGVPANVHAQFHIGDDGPLSGGAAWIVPKIVFTDPGVTKILGRVSHTQIVAGGQVPIDTVFAKISENPHALEVAHPVAVPTPAASDDNSATDSEQPPEFGTLAWGLNLLQTRWQFFVAGFAIFIIALIAWAARNL